MAICNVNPLNEQRTYNYTLSKVSQAACFKLKNGTPLRKCMNSINAASATYDSFMKKLKAIIGSDTRLRDYDYYNLGYDLKDDGIL